MPAELSEYFSLPSIPAWQLGVTKNGDEPLERGERVLPLRQVLPMGWGSTESTVGPRSSPRGPFAVDAVLAGSRAVDDPLVLHLDQGYGTAPRRHVGASVRSGLRQIRSLLPLLRCNLCAEWHPEATASDASPYGLGVCQRTAPCPEIAALGRTSEGWRFRVEDAVRAREHALAQLIEESFENVALRLVLRCSSGGGLEGCR